MLLCECAARDRTGDEHGELAARGQDGVDRHDHEDRVGAVARDGVGERLRDRRDDGPVHRAVITVTTGSESFLNGPVSSCAPTLF